MPYLKLIGKFDLLCEGLQEENIKVDIGKDVVMTRHSHRFVEKFDGFSGYGLDRQSNENTVQLYLQKLSDDHLMKTILKRMTDDDLTKLFEITSEMMKKYLTEPEYHQLFLKEEQR